MVGCSRCKGRAVTFIRYSGAHLCKRHFDDFFLKRVKKEIRWQLDVKKSKNVAVAISGGKDSAAALVALNEILGDIPAIRITAVTIDEGIEGYRPPNIEAASELCESIGVGHEIISFREKMGITLDQASEVCDPLTPCSNCGVWRKKYLNLAAREIDADALAMGHNLDDMAQSIAMNIFGAEVDKLVRMGPHRRVIPGLIPRIMPLRTIPEKECYLWARLRGIPFVDEVCPYSETAHRGLFRDIVNQVERNTPGTRHRLLRSHETIYEHMTDGTDRGVLERCNVCGEVASGDICQACEMEEDVKGRLAER